MNQLQSLQPYHYEAMRLKLAGDSYADISEKIKYNAGTIGNWFSCDELFKSEYEIIKAETVTKTKERILNAADKAAEKLTVLLDNDDSRIVLSASKDILDRAGFGGTSKSAFLITNPDEPTKLEDFF